MGPRRGARSGACPGAPVIVIRVELWSARTGRKTTLGLMKMSNYGCNETGEVCDYHGEVMRRPKFERVTREGHVEGHRRNTYTVWTLLRRMLEDMGY